MGTSISSRKTAAALGSAAIEGLEREFDSLLYYRLRLIALALVLSVNR